ncbi:HAD family phosphatase, partial [Candidatus Saccharibacteria bacterium]|nr:HAD family phosphatase [Candidatus Saccharibacteria bacterium]
MPSIQSTKNSGKRFAVFDIDGTLIRWQLYHAVVDRLAKKQLLGKNSKQLLNEARMHWKRREHPEAFKKYEVELINIYETALGQLTTDQFDKAVSEIANEYRFQTYAFTKDFAKSLKNKGYVLIAISGSHQELVNDVARQHGFDICVGTQYERKNGHFTGKKTVGSHGKLSTLKGIIAEHSLVNEASYGIGDSESDSEMLASVENPIAFNPDSKLYEIAKNSGWPIIVERKNV